MARNREAYEQAMNAGHNAAWDQDWGVAVASYGRAIQEFPDDPEAHIHLGLGLLEMGRLEDALKVYTRAHQLAPNDPIPLEKSADVLERMGRLREAAQQYVNVSEVYLSQRDLDKAIGNWERATRLTPGLVPIHAKLAQAYERIGDKKKAIYEYLTLAFNFRRVNDVDKAIKAAQRALRLDKNNAQVLNAIHVLQSGGDILPPTNDGIIVDNHKEVAFNHEDAKKAVSDDDPLGPMGEAMNYALGLLAAYVMEGGEAFKIAADALQAMEAHRQGFNEQAIEAYQRADAKLRHPAIKMNLGGLLVLTDQDNEAIKPLMDAINHPQMATGGYHGLGKAYYKLQKHRQAVKYLLQSLQMVDSAQALVDEEADQVNSIYAQLGSVLETVNDENIAIIAKRFTELLEGKEWKLRISDTRRQLEETLREQGERGVIDILIAEEGDRLTQSIGLIDRYSRQGLLTLAMDEAHRAVEFSPNYLPVHIRMAEIMIREGRLRNAVAKYNTIARTYLARGENDRARQILSSVLEMAPLDVAVRESLIELLEQEEKWDEALDQYIDLADTHHQLGNFDKSRETYVLAERIAVRVNATPDKIVRIKHRIADIDQMRLDTRKAQKTYEEIIQLDPNDERAHRQLVDINYRQGNQVEAIRRLDKLLGLYARQKQVNRITQLLEELVTLYQNDTGLRSRLAAIYRQLGRTHDAIVQLDALGELQLEAGLHKDAANTIRQIITMNPDHLDDYKKLLAQLGG
ncbi:MAG TPA: tetratricopeptide repeat protein [Phototrophicaceae bacterium]|nr:tetratricopeptide repeat protein [Phototrophicaceae bacterium]